ncbi:MAG: hypothetical protein INQ03_04450 [Candidatus Heimdallarchaeota archaeon]|nr:hypothetical protein [Candidatus Heimdallarchaeota archaeon]
MVSLPEILNTVVEELDSLDIERENIISKTRELNRLSGRGIALLVKNQDAKSMLMDCRRVYLEIYEKMSSMAAITSWNITNSGVEEYAEFEILYSILTERTIPSPKKLQIPTWMWLPALGDVTGELRRVILNNLLIDQFELGLELLQIMQEIFHELRGLNFSKSLVSNLRKKIDVARITMERTESDILNYKLSKGGKSS